MKEETIYEKAVRVKIDSYMEKRGFEFKKEWGKIRTCRSPFANDSNPSFCYYEDTNSFFCYASGQGGNILNLINLMDGVTFREAAVYILEDTDLDSYDKDFVPRKREPIPFDLDKFKIKFNNRQVNLVKKYAKGRGITDGVEYCKYFVHNGVDFDHVLALGFLHTDIDGKECGLKLRAIDPSVEPRFSARGSMKYYVLDNTLKSSYEDTTMFIVESESSANSLWEYLKENEINSVVISFGAVSTIPKELPTKYAHIKKRKIIIDYDGDEKLFKKRIAMYSHLNGETIKLKLAKGEDINSIYAKGKINILKLW